MDSDNDGVGDIDGVIEKLNYLNDSTDNSLGIDAVWLSPIYKSPQGDFGYDISDYKDIDPLFGTLEKFKKLLSEAHARGIKIMMDFVPNHTSTKHRWFQEAKSSINNSKRDYYIWASPKADGTPPNNWLSAFGGSAWEYDKSTKQYYLHSFDVSQADLNWRNPQVEKEMLETLDFWLELGVDGFRVDVPEYMFKDKELRDEPLNPNYIKGEMDPNKELLHIYTFALPEYLGIVKKFVGVIDKYQNKFVVTEVWSPMADLVKLYSEIDKKWFTPFNFGFITLPWGALSHKEYIDEYDFLVGSFDYPTYVLGSHDRPRVVSRVGQSQARIGAMLLLTLRGMPYIYYGDEIGMSDGIIPTNKIQDPFEKKTPRMGFGRDPQRTPMQWDNSLNAGFSAGDPWLPVSENYKQINVSDELKDPNSFFALYKTLISLRKKYKALSRGMYKSLSQSNENIFAYMRVEDQEMILIVLNYTDELQSIDLPFEQGEILCNTLLSEKIGETIQIKNLKLLPNEGYVFQIIYS